MKSCPVCQDPLIENRTECAGCKVQYHPDCADYAFRCRTFNCETKLYNPNTNPDVTYFGTRRYPRLYLKRKVKPVLDDIIILTTTKGRIKQGMEEDHTKSLNSYTRTIRGRGNPPKLFRDLIHTRDRLKEYYSRRLKKMPRMFEIKQNLKQEPTRLYNALEEYLESFNPRHPSRLLQIIDKRIQPLSSEKETEGNTLVWFSHKLAELLEINLDTHPRSLTTFRTYQKDSLHGVLFAIEAPLAGMLVGISPVVPQAIPYSILVGGLAQRSYQRWRYAKPGQNLHQNYASFLETVNQDIVSHLKVIYSATHQMA